MSTDLFPPVPEGFPDEPVYDVANRLNSSTIHFLRFLRTLSHDDVLTPDRRSLLSLLVFGGPQRMSGIAGKELISIPAASRMVKALEAQGLVRRARDGDDGRVVIVEATPKGRELMDEGRARRVRGLASNLKRLSSADIEALGRAADLLEMLSRQSGSAKGGA